MYIGTKIPTYLGRYTKKSGDMEIRKGRQMEDWRDVVGLPQNRRKYFLNWTMHACTMIMK
jgi:hypothetical protein